jgi:hypothetical protein
LGTDRATRVEIHPIPIVLSPSEMCENVLLDGSGRRAIVWRRAHGQHDPRRHADRGGGRFGSGLLVAERQFRKVIGHRQIPLLLSSMAAAVSKKSIAKGAAVA